MPDPVDVQRLDFDLAAENITPEEYIAQINQWANQIAPFDLQASWELRTEAQKFLDAEHTPIEDPSILGQAPGSAGTTSDGIGGGYRGYTGPVDVVRRLRGNAIKFITQFDGSKYSGTNCAMAAGAMLAHAMGYAGFSGADLRSASGDTQGGTNMGNVATALTRVGVEGARLNYSNSVAYDTFKKRLVNGAPAVLAGWTGDIPPQFNSTSGIMGHSIMVAGYDEKRKAYLVLDPSDKRKTGVWWPETVVEDFAWGGTYNGMAVFAPKGTIDPKTLKRTGGGKVEKINVDAPPQQPGSQPMTQFDPGPFATGALNKLADEELLLQRERLRDGGVTDDDLARLTSEQRVETLIDDRGDEIGELQDVIDRVLRQVETTGEYEGEIEMLGTGEVLTDGDIEAIQKQLIHLYDAQEVLYRSVNAKEKAREQLNSRRSVLLGARVLNSLETEYATNTEIQEIQRSFEDLGKAKTPEEYRAITESIKEGVEVLGTLNEEDEEEVEGSEEINTEADAEASTVGDVSMPATDEILSAWDSIIEALDGEYGSADELAQGVLEAIGEADLEFAQTEAGDAFLRQLTKVYAEDIGINETEETGWIMLPMQSGGHQLTPVVLRESQDWDDEKQEWFDTKVPDIASLGEAAVELFDSMDLDINDMPTVRVPGLDGVDRIDVVPRQQDYPGVKFLIWGDPDIGGNEVDLETEKELDNLGITAEETNDGQPLTEEQINKITSDPNIVDMMIRRGQLVESGWPVMTYESGGDTWYMDKLVGEDGTQSFWYKDALPFVGRVLPEGVSPINSRTGKLRGGVGGEDHFNAGHFGATIGANGVLWIDFNPEEGDYDDAGVGSPFIDDGISSDQARKDTVNNGGTPANTWVRDPANPHEAIAIGADNARHYMNPQAMTLNAWLNDQQLIKNQVADKMASRMEPAQAAELAFMDPLEFAQAAYAMDINPNNAEDITREGGAPGAPGLGSVLGTELGITPGSEEEKVAEPETFDHMAAAKSGALGVAKANAADRASKVAAAQEAASAASAATSVPRIKPASAVTTTGASSYKPKTPTGTPRGTGVPEQTLPTPGPSAPSQPAPRQPTPGTGRKNF